MAAPSPFAGEHSGDGSFCVRETQWGRFFLCSGNTVETAEYAKTAGGKHDFRLDPCVLRIFCGCAWFFARFSSETGLFCHNKEDMLTITYKNRINIHFNRTQVENLRKSRGVNLVKSFIGKALSGVECLGFHTAGRFFLCSKELPYQCMLHRSMSSSTGQWSLPPTSSSMVTSCTRPAILSETTK